MPARLRHEIARAYRYTHTHTHTHTHTRTQLEWAYSFVDGLKKYSKEKLVIRVFKDMLDGNAVPEVFYEVYVRAKKREMAKAHARERERECV